jgi:hypothetical protein
VNDFVLLFFAVIQAFIPVGENCGRVYAIDHARRELVIRQYLPTRKVVRLRVHSTTIDRMTVELEACRNTDWILGLRWDEGGSINRIEPMSRDNAERVFAGILTAPR